jgi:hypothetical protein
MQNTSDIEELEWLPLYRFGVSDLGVGMLVFSGHFDD